MYVLSLLPSVKEFILKVEKKDDRNEEDRLRPVAKSFANWLQGICIYASVLCKRFPERSLGIFQHVQEAYRNFGGFSWYTYDEAFRQKLADSRVYNGVQQMLVFGLIFSFLKYQIFLDPQ